MNGSDGGAIPINYRTSMSSQQQAQQQHWQPTQNNTSFVQQQANNQQLPLLPAFTAMLQLNSSSGGSYPWNCQDSMSITQAQLLAPQQGLGEPNNTFPGIVQQEQYLHIPLLPSYTDKLQQNSISGPSAWRTAGGNSSGQAWAAAMPPALCNNYSVFGTNSSGSSSSSASASMPWNMSSSSMEYSNALKNLGLGFMENPSSSRLPPRPPSFNVGAGASSSTLWRGAHGDFFSEADMEAISKDKILKKIVSTDPQRVKRILSNRDSVAKLNSQKMNRVLDLQRMFEALRQRDCMQLSTQASVTTADHNTQDSEMRFKQMLNEQASLNEAVSGQLQPAIQSLAVLQFNMLGANANGTQDPMRSQTAGENGWHADGLYTPENSNRNDLRGSHQLPTQVQTPQHEQQLHQATDDEFVMGQPQKPWNF
ncbi:hypothetical protein HU200_028981 [Digitaria exilis]|uniref:Uncharacterized protein n=1 Tax=Digitaria exilis TaxID=1010633 RepID=A0A835BR24_9POAL|nr:hypothetical protein HU200_028981 [Digitaria exilis]